MNGKGVCRDIEKLEPVLRERVRKLLSVFKERGIPVGISETLRYDNVQKCYYMQGRCTLEKVNEARKEAGLYLLSESENKNTVTNCDGVNHRSNHQERNGTGLGYAVDLVPLNEKGNFWWNAPEKIWREMGAIAEEYGVDWCAGGKGEDWKGFDNPHYELLKDWSEAPKPTT